MKKRRIGTLGLCLLCEDQPLSPIINVSDTDDESEEEDECEDDGSIELIAAIEGELRSKRAIEKKVETGRQR